MNVSSQTHLICVLNTTSHTPASLQVTPLQGPGVGDGVGDGVGSLLGCDENDGTNDDK